MADKSIQLPRPDILKEKAVRTAVLDAVLMQEWEYRYYSFNSHWGEGEEMSSMRDGSGNEFYILFKGSECFIKVIEKGIDNTEYILKEAALMQGHEKEALRYFLSEPAFDPEYISFLFWNADGRWKNLGAGKTELLNIFLNTESEYLKFAEECYERKISPKLIHTFLNSTLSQDLFLKLNPELDLEILKADLQEIGISVSSF